MSEETGRTIRRRVWTAAEVKYHRENRENATLLEVQKADSYKECQWALRRVLYANDPVSDMRRLDEDETKPEVRGVLLS